MFRIFLFTLVFAVPPLSLQAEEIDFVRDVRPILRKHCYACHGESKQKSGLRLDIKSEAFKGGEAWGPSIVAGKAAESPLMELVSSQEEGSRMPPEGKPLSAAEIRTLRTWIDSGAVWPDGVDLAKLENRLDHWSFKPPRLPEMPAVLQQDWGRNPIDAFILSRLEQQKFTPAPPTDPAAWLRRVTLDLTGLPPTFKQITAFVREAEKGEAAYLAVVDRLLNSPAYGERQAQHWLDVVRYADTHGFEVNTERPNAWPYRDYVIAAFNADTPYNRFIQEQIAGDALGKDAATGFLVTASVLLPGQIGKDAPSIRLARQDALDEIVNNIGQTFLGLSVGCARCHDHKFDPITAKDYYSMQAFVAGVEYGDRVMRSSQTEAIEQANSLAHQRIEQIEQRLADLAPFANPIREDQPEHPATNARENTETFPPREVRFVRFTIHDANLHPSLGLIEPCIDEFQIFTDEASPRNVALSSLGVKVTASGSRTSAKHKLEHINDGQFGNSRSWMSDTRGRGQVLFELPTKTRIAKIVWSRDRQGEFTDRLPIAYTLEAGLSTETLTTIVHVLPKRPAVRALKNVDRFQPVQTKRLRFTILATNTLEPCVDELEVFNVSGENIALASRGTVVKTSGDTIAPDRHEPRFLNDGKYGNSRSWMSNTPGKGQVELEFPSEQEISRVVWGRDREGKFQDRLAVNYRIEVETKAGWKLVADSTDRRAPNTSPSRKQEFQLAGLTPAESEQARTLLAEKQALEKRIQSSEETQKAFAGIFRKPDDIHLLRRGDPEQPVEPVPPAVLSAIGKLSLSRESNEQSRRRALADWIASPENPLTARVMVNRIWQWHFGNGLVTTANDFGRNGVNPSHPELLDWLAHEFIRSGWSVKHMHRLVVLSSTYRQSTQYNSKAAAVDANVRLLWRYPSRRLEAEAIRDCMLSMSGQLNGKMGGRGFDLFNKRGGLTGFTPVESFSGEGLRRMIYAHRVRRERDAVFGAFDCPDNGQSTARRIESTTPIQALNLFNSRFTIEQANLFASRVQREVGDDLPAQIRRVYQIALGRDPLPAEVTEVEAAVRTHGLAMLCRVLFNSNEFLFLP